MTSVFINADPEKSKNKSPNVQGTRAEMETVKMMKEALEKIVSDKEKEAEGGCAN